MTNYFTSLAALGPMSPPMQSSAQILSASNNDGYRAQRAAAETGLQDQNIHVSRITRDYNPGPAFVNAVFNLEQRAAEESHAIGSIRRREMDSSAHAYSAQELSRADSIAGLMEEEIRAYEATLEGIPKNYVEASNTDLPREFANLYVSESSYSTIATLMREQDRFTGSILNVVS